MPTSASSSAWCGRVGWTPPDATRATGSRALPAGADICDDGCNGARRVNTPQPACELPSAAARTQLGQVSSQVLELRSRHHVRWKPAQ